MLFRIKEYQKKQRHGIFSRTTTREIQIVYSFYNSNYVLENVHANTIALRLYYFMLIPSVGYLVSDFPMSPLFFW